MSRFRFYHRPDWWWALVAEVHALLTSIETTEHPEGLE